MTLSSILVGMPFWRWLVVGGLLLAYFVVLRIIHLLLTRRREAIKDREEVRGLYLFLDGFIGPLKIGFLAPVLWGVGLVVILPEAMTTWPATWGRWLAVAAIAYFVYRQTAVLEHYLSKVAQRTESKLDNMLVPLIRRTIRVLIILIFGLYLVEAVSGRPITTVLAGLGLGGLAFALAAQDTLKNFFGAIMILVDKPFAVGDRVITGEVDGFVEDMSFRSTRVRNFDGHLVTIPNEKVAVDRVVNVSKRPFIRQIVDLSLTYDTPPAKMERAIQIVHEAIDNDPHMVPASPPKVFFNQFGPDYLNLRIYYWYAPPDFWEFQAFNHKLNLTLLQAFNAEGIEFAFPTRTLYLASDPARALSLKVNKDSPPD